MELLILTTEHSLLKKMGKANSKKKAWKDKLTLLNILRKRMKRAKSESKSLEIQSKINSIKSKL